MTYRASQHKKGSFANRPPATGSGEQYFCTDSPISYMDDPATATWIPFTQQDTGGAALLASNYTIVTTLNSLNLYQQGDVIRAAATKGYASCALRAGTLTAGTPWMVTLEAQHLPYQTQYPNCGVVVATGNTTSATGYAMSRWWNNNVPGFHNETFTVGTQSRSSVGTETGTVSFAAPDRCLFRMISDGTKMYCFYSTDGIYWQWWGAAINTPASLTHWGFYLGTAGGNFSGYGQATIYKNALTTPVQQAVTNATNANPIVLTVASTAAFHSADLVSIRGVLGNTNANQDIIFIRVLSATTIELDTAAGNNPWTSGGTVTLLSG